jgi:putative membrane protein
MRKRWFAALVVTAGLAGLAGVLAGPAAHTGWASSGGPGRSGITAQTAPAPSTPNSPAAPGTPGYGPGFGPGYGSGFGRGGMPFRRGGRGFGARAGLAAGIFAIGALLRFLVLIAVLVIAWKVINLRSLWGRPDGAVQTLRERFARGEISEEEFRKRLGVLS